MLRCVVKVSSLCRATAAHYRPQRQPTILSFCRKNIKFIRRCSAGKITCLAQHTHPRTRQITCVPNECLDNVHSNSLPFSGGSYPSQPNSRGHGLVVFGWLLLLFLLHIPHILADWFLRWLVMVKGRTGVFHTEQQKKKKE